jgi:hypothetical protein
LTHVDASIRVRQVIDSHRCVKETDVTATACCADYATAAFPQPAANACCVASTASRPPTFAVRGASPWPDAAAWGLTVAGVVLTGYAVLAEVSRALGSLRSL